VNSTNPVVSRTDRTPAGRNLRKLGKRDMLYPPPLDQTSAICRVADALAKLKGTQNALAKLMNNRPCDRHGNAMRQNAAFVGWRLYLSVVFGVF